VRAVYVSAGHAQWLEACRMLNRLPALQSFVLVLGSSWFCEPVEKLPVFLEPLSGLRVDCSRGLLRRTVGLDPVLVETSSDEESSSSSVSSSSSSSSPASSPRPVLFSRACSCPQFASGMLADAKSPSKGDPVLASWELRLQGQSYYAHELARIGEDLQRRGIDCCITTA